MKIKNDFTTNSSSSSFIVAFKDIPNSPEELKTMLFGDDSTFVNKYSGEQYPSEDIAGVVFSDMEEPATDEMLLDELEHVCSGEIYFGIGVNRDIDWGELIRKTKEHSKKKLDELKKQYKGNAFFIFEYSDSDGDMHTAMEHCDLFRRLPHIIISKH